MAKRKPEPKAVVSMHAQCSYPLTEDAIAASDNCNRPATTVVQSRETGNWLYRCREHRGEVRFGVYGRVRYQMPVT